MSISEIRKLIKKHLGPYMKEFEFEIQKGDAGGFLLLHKNESIQLGVTFDCKERPNGEELGAGSLSIMFISVEKVIFPIVNKYKLHTKATEPQEYSSTIGNHDNTENGISQREKLTSVHISNEEDVVQYCEIVKAYMEQYAFPWFSKYSKLEGVNEFINSVGMQDILNCFSAPFPSQFYRAMVITEKCGNRKRTLEIKEECLRRFKDCETDSFYKKEKIQSYYDSLSEICSVLGV